jgi:sec-independent protein translocase protein TatA
MNLGTTEILLILAVVLLLFGGRKLPELAKGLGKSLRIFKDEMKNPDDKSND